MLIFFYYDCRDLNFFTQWIHLLHQLFILSDESANDVKILLLLGLTPRFSQLIHDKRAVKSVKIYNTLHNR